MSHQLTYIVTETVEYEARADKDGNLAVTGRAEVLDIHEASVCCSACGFLNADELAAHGLSDYWEQV